MLVSVFGVILGLRIASVKRRLKMNEYLKYVLIGFAAALLVDKVSAKISA